MIPSPNDNAAAIALNRFGLGARPEDTPPADPKRWLLSQFDQYQPLPAAWAGQPVRRHDVAGGRGCRARSRRRPPSRYRQENRRGPANARDASIPIGGRQSARVQGLTPTWRHARSACRHEKGCADNSIGALCRHCFYLADHCSTAKTTLLYAPML